MLTKNYLNLTLIFKTIVLTHLFLLIYIHGKLIDSIISKSAKKRLPE